MAIKNSKEETQTANEQTDSELLKYGITRVSTDYFYYGEYKYTDAKDAIAQAKRDEKAGRK